MNFLGLSLFFQYGEWTVLSPPCFSNRRLLLRPRLRDRETTFSVCPSSLRRRSTRGPQKKELYREKSSCLDRFCRHFSLFSPFAFSFPRSSLPPVEVQQHFFLLFPIFGRSLPGLSDIATSNERKDFFPRKNAINFMRNSLYPGLFLFLSWSVQVWLPCLLFCTLPLRWFGGGRRGEIRADDSEKKEEREWVKKCCT